MEDLFGNAVSEEPKRARDSSSGVNDMAMVMDVVRTASGGEDSMGYVLAGRNQRVYRRVDRETMTPVPVWEADTVRQCIRSGLLKTGGTHVLRCGAVRGPAVSLLVPKSTRVQLARWQVLKRPASWPV
ncbi:hypothetical protein FHR81_003184 [Actinoalloteichus hoggarensis]|uniref:Uncharacterized protein n=1 Tax=Actinoalloteichus hoggarensis TaxID=1470176 RepID=A0A221W762_9PSEU|nr:hypothetical protein AHOG_19595 [Actinoalloteichus hoggarensis]MBB5922132.1 hypothetical protein [Actinoalloteichus hoggarensis]